ncbi:hypothetical protein GCM10022223_45850 [Kineosporia mesophila]|uniref:PIN domain-containing protein n=1 Tax=Kineosporia mesophila TaxID=566012 RepID=A0ABP7A2H5_9ACTN|nr:hypothetical protein [Kineosporia mesophila]MCD5349000.1 hypothetical protein [Kineosporia mesophila]
MTIRSTGEKGVVQLQVWFIDTSALMSAAVSLHLDREIQSAIGTDPCMLLDVVVDELRYRAATDGRRSLAEIALGSLARYGPPVKTLGLVAEADVRGIQALLSDPHPLRHPAEHYAESVAIEMMRAAHNRGSQHRFRFLSEDYDARVAANQVPSCEPLSTPRLLWARVRQGGLAAAQAVSITDELMRAGRCRDFTVAELSGSQRARLGRAGHP